MKKHVFSILAALSMAGGSAAQTLLVADSQTDSFNLHSLSGGEYLQSWAIQLSGAAPPPGTPYEAVELPSETWITDRTAGTVYRYSRDGKTFLGTATTGLSGITGACAANGSVYVTNDTGCREYALDGTLLNTFPGTVSDASDDVIDGGGELLLSRNATISRFAYDGTYLGVFNQPSNVSTIQQIARSSNGNVLATSINGLYEFDSSGVLLRSWGPAIVGGGLRGVAPLDDGNILYTSAAGLALLDTSSNTSTMIDGGGGKRFISRAGAQAVPGTAFCLGDGTGTPCPCGNDNDGSNGPSGCANGSSGGGVWLAGVGTPFVWAGEMMLVVYGAPPGQPGLFFSADNAITGGLGTVFGDGLHCAGGGVLRIEVTSANAVGFAMSTAHINPSLLPGTKRYQYWYRDPSASPCGANFNLSNGFEVVFL